jgi:hypothetical protein
LKTVLLEYPAGFILRVNRTEQWHPDPPIQSQHLDSALRIPYSSPINIP